MTLGEHDHIVGAWAESYSTTSWSNRLVWVCIRSGLDGSHRVDALQPEEQSAEILQMFPFALVASNHLVGAVQRLACKPITRKRTPRAATVRPPHSSKPHNARRAASRSGAEGERDPKEKGR